MIIIAIGSVVGVVCSQHEDSLRAQIQEDDAQIYYHRFNVSKTTQYYYYYCYYKYCISLTVSFHLSLISIYLSTIVEEK